MLWDCVCFFVWIFGYRLTGMDDPALPTSQRIQCFCIVTILFGLPLLISPSLILRLARLEEKPTVQCEHT